MREGTPQFIKMLVGAELAEEVHQEDSIVTIPLYRVGETERASIQLWFRKEDEGFQAVLEMIDSKDSPRYLPLTPMVKTEQEFKEALTGFFKQSHSDFPRFKDILKIIVLELES